jgi:hypothetical protein
VKASLTLNGSDVALAVKEYVERNGWIVAGTVSLSACESHDPRGERTGYAVSATVDVETRATMGRGGGGIEK